MITLGRIKSVTGTRVEVQTDDRNRQVDVVVPNGVTPSVGSRATITWDSGTKRWLLITVYPLGF